ncbi:hypothetical protein TNCT_76061 [Trichonephila clavata]|uniref:RNase H type-1 domain-containing protein n=1 Tax=Trichonephila clavata TaxID=2740835 RepID=A0A8X6GND6_TRICU|nr:hypothetical protein TNCT_76061 [Trichonephila clavata]
MGESSNPSVMFYSRHKKHIGTSIRSGELQRSFSLKFNGNWKNVGDRIRISILRLLDKLSANFEFHIEWIPSHVGIIGKDIADSLSKAATLDTPWADMLSFSSGMFSDKSVPEITRTEREIPFPYKIRSDNNSVYALRRSTPTENLLTSICPSEMGVRRVCQKIIKTEAAFDSYQSHPLPLTPYRFANNLLLPSP